MCGRFALGTPVQELATKIDAESLSDLTPFKPSWNVAPKAYIPVATQVDPNGQPDVQRHFRLMRWGFRPSWAKPSHREPINARSETMTEKPMFRAASERRRGVVPADGWYEWMTTPQGKTPWFHQRSDQRACWMGVLWDTWTDGHEHMESCVLLTQPANEDCRGRPRQDACDHRAGPCCRLAFGRGSSTRTRTWTHQASSGWSGGEPYR